MEKLKNILYRDKLDPVEKSRYMDKIRFINDQDPLDFEVIKTWTRQCEELLPAISYFDIVNYLVYGTSTYTQEQFKCYKGLEAYNQFVCGWVSDRAVYQCADKKHVVVSAKVNHIRQGTFLTFKLLISLLLLSTRSVANDLNNYSILYQSIVTGCLSWVPNVIGGEKLWVNRDSNPVPSVTGREL